MSVTTSAATRAGREVIPDVFMCPSPSVPPPGWLAGACRVKGAGVQPFTPVSVTPSMNTRWAKKKSTITGSVKSTEAAITTFHCTPK
jgi:hypothetical protein